MKVYVLAVVLLTMCLAVSGCNTAKGFVGDLEWTGEKISDGVSKTFH